MFNAKEDFKKRMRLRKVEEALLRGMNDGKKGTKQDRNLPLPPRDVKSLEIEDEDLRRKPGRPKGKDMRMLRINRHRDTEEYSFQTIKLEDIHRGKCEPPDEDCYPIVALTGRGLTRIVRTLQVYLQGIAPHIEQSERFFAPYEWDPEVRRCRSLTDLKKKLRILTHKYLTEHPKRR